MSNPVAVASVIAFAVSFVARAEPAATASAESKPAPKPAFYRGTAISYGHSATAYSFNPAGDTVGEVGRSMYNPTWAHKLELVPEFHVGEQFYARARLSFAQEFTDSDDATYNHEVQLSDLAVEGGVAGWTEKLTGLHLGGNLRLTAPTSKASQYRTMVLSVGPGVSLSRKFKVLSGLTLAYAGRYTYRFNRFTTAQTTAPTNQGCLDVRNPECADLLNTGRRNAHSDLTHGPSLGFAPLEVLSASASFQLAHAFLYPVPASDAQFQSQAMADQLASDNPVRTYSVFDLNVSWQVTRPVGLTLGAYTLTPGLNPGGSNLFVLFNRNTTLYLDATVDLEAVVQGIFGEST